MNKNKIGLVLFTLIVLFGIIYFMIDKTNDNSEIAIQDTVTPNLKADTVDVAPSTVTPNLTEGTKNTLPSKVTENWKTYKNDTYGIELKYPSEWQAHTEGKSPGLGMRYEYAIFFGNKTNAPEETAFTIKIYPKEDTLADIRYTDEISSTADNYTTCISNFTKNLALGVNSYPAKEVYANSNTCIAETYFYSVQVDEYVYNIVPSPKGGTGYVGYDGKVKTQQYFPEFYDILSTITFTK